MGCGQVWEDRRSPKEGGSMPEGHMQDATPRGPSLPHPNSGLWPMHLTSSPITCRPGLTGLRQDLLELTLQVQPQITLPQEVKGPQFTKV